MKCLTFWLASLTLIMITFAAGLVTPGIMDDISGLVIRFFLGYCGIIMAAQMLASLFAIRRRLVDIFSAKPVSHCAFCVDDDNFAQG